MLLPYRLKLLQSLVVLNSNYLCPNSRQQGLLEFGDAGDYGYRWWQFPEFIATKGD